MPSFHTIGRCSRLHILYSTYSTYHKRRVVRQSKLGLASASSTFSSSNHKRRVVRQSMLGSPSHSESGFRTRAWFGPSMSRGPIVRLGWASCVMLYISLCWASCVTFWPPYSLTKQIITMARNRVRAVDNMSNILLFMMPPPTCEVNIYHPYELKHLTSYQTVPIIFWNQRGKLRTKDEDETLDMVKFLLGRNRRFLSACSRLWRSKLQTVSAVAASRLSVKPTHLWVISNDQEVI